MFTYEIILNGKVIETEKLEGIALLKFQSASLLGDAKWRMVYDGPKLKYDPVLHSPRVYNTQLGGWQDE